MGKATPAGMFYGTQGGGTAAYDECGNLYFLEGPDWAPEMKGQVVPEEWGIAGPFNADGTQATNADFTRCSKCGGETDSEGWCANYCMEG